MSSQLKQVYCSSEIAAGYIQNDNLKFLAHKAQIACFSNSVIMHDHVAGTFCCAENTTMANTDLDMSQEFVLPQTDGIEE